MHAPHKYRDARRRLKEWREQFGDKQETVVAGLAETAAVPRE